MDFGGKYRFIGEERGRVIGVDFDDVQIEVVETVVKIKQMDVLKNCVREYVISCGRHILWFQRGSEHASEDEISRCNESGSLQSRTGG